MIFKPTAIGRSRVRRVALAVASAAALALCAAPIAGASSTVVVPVGGEFEQTPLTYTTSDTCGLLCSISTTRQSEGSNHYLATEYSSLLGVIGTSAGTATISSPEFTWSEATPSVVSFSFERRSSIGSIVAIDGGIPFTATLVDDTTSTSRTLTSEELTVAEPAFHTVSVSLAPSALLDGHTYHLAIAEHFDALVGAVTAASIDLDDVGLEVTPADTAPSIGETSVSTPTEHSVEAATTVQTFGHAATYAIEYGPTTSYGSVSSIQGIPAGGEGSRQVTSTLTGLIPGTTYHARFSVADVEGTSYGADFTFTTAPISPPSVGEATVGEVSAGAAIVSATVDPGANETSVHVNYGTSTSYGQSTTTQTLSAGSGPSSVQIPLSGLSAGTTYHADVIATNADGASESHDVSFKTASVGGGAPSGPEVGPSSASEVRERSATLEGSVNPAGEAASYEVEYGPSSSYGSTTTVHSIPAGSTGAQAVAVQISGLEPGTTYHARLVASDADGTHDGLDVVFTTAAASPPTVGAASIGEVTGTAATVTATVEPGANETSVQVDYGTTIAYGQSTAGQALAPGSGPSTVQIPLSGLSPETDYHAVVLVTNADGSSESHDLTFTTGSGGTGAAGDGEPPSIAATAVVGKTETAAQVLATIDPHEEEASYAVQYGASTAYGSRTSPETIPSGTKASTAADVTLSGLAPGSTYYARYEVVTGAGTTFGPSVTFKTLGAATGGSSVGTGAGTDTGSSTGASPTSTSTSAPTDAVASCLRVQSRRRGLAARLLSVPAAVQITASHPLRVSLDRTARSAGALRYSLDGAPLTATSRRSVSIVPSQLQAGRATVLRLLLRVSRRSTRSLRVALMVSHCGAVLSVRRTGSRLQVAVRNLTKSSRVAVTLPGIVGVPTALTLLTATKNRAYRLRTSGSRVRLAPGAGQLRVLRSGHTLVVSGLSSQVTGVLLRVRIPREPSGRVTARITSTGSLQALEAAVR